MIDQRQQQRQLIALQVVAGGSVHCTLLDVSRDGARLATNRRLPNRFYVMLKPDLKRWCQVMWRRRDEIGVKFIRDPERAVTKQTARGSQTDMEGRRQHEDFNR